MPLNPQHQIFSKCHTACIHLFRHSPILLWFAYPSHSWSPLQHHWSAYHVVIGKLIDTNVHTWMLSSIAYTCHLDHSWELSHVLLGLAASVTQHMHGTIVICARAREEACVNHKLLYVIGHHAPDFDLHCKLTDLAWVQQSMHISNFAITWNMRLQAYASACAQACILVVIKEGSMAVDKGVHNRDGLIHLLDYGINHTIQQISRDSRATSISYHLLHCIKFFCVPFLLQVQPLDNAL